MKKVLLILAFLAIGMIATAQTQTIYNQLKLATVNDGTANDSLVLVQGTDKIIRKIPLSSISGSTEIPSLQEVTNNGNITSHPIYAKEFRVDSSPDSLMVLNNRYFSIGDLGNDYNGGWTKFFSLFDPQNYADGFSMFSYNYDETKSVDVTAYAGYVRLSPTFDSDTSKRSELVMQDNIFYQGSGNKMGTLIGNYTQYFGEAQLGVVEDNLFYRTYSDPEVSEYTYWFRVHPSESTIYLNADQFTLNENVQLLTNNVVDSQNYEFPEIGGTLATQEWAEHELSFSLQSVTDIGNTTSNNIIVVSPDEAIMGVGNATTSKSIVLRNDVTIDFAQGSSAVATLASNNITEIRNIELPDYSGELLLKERDFGAYGNYNFGGQYSSYPELQQYYMEAAGNGVDGLNNTYKFRLNAEEGIGLSGENSSTSANVTVSSEAVLLSASDNVLGYSQHIISATNFSYDFDSTSDGYDRYTFNPASNTSAAETANYYMPMKSGHLAVIGQTAPASATDTGVVGEIRVTDTYIYVCTATNTWVRAPLATW